ncbi:MAG: fused MFS/spermidine synthase [Thaumarchaeota archaeon]|nr:fused MFS/spermidine synthase [Nitrososphaerota archaeon]
MFKNQILVLLRHGKFWKLGLIVFISGAIVMALEIIASRIVTPVFGSTVYTWGSLIGIILSGLSIGYFIGGRIADKNPTFQKICSVIFSAGLYIIFIPFIAPSVIGMFATALPNSQFAPLLAILTILIWPSILLGFVSPYSIKLATTTLKKVGNISGNLYSLATIGSICGTFLAVFVLIPIFEVRYIIFGLGLSLMAGSLVGLRTIPKIILVIVIIILFSPWTSVVGSIIPHIGETVFEKETPYSHLDVIDSGNIRTLYLNGMRHSAMNLNDPSDLVLQYTKYFHLAKIFNPSFEKVLFIGGGGFSGPKNFIASYADIQIDVVEIDPDVIDTAKKYFSLTDDSRLRIFNEDARTFLMRSEEKYDVIILDAYATNYVPFHLLTNEYFQILDSRLSSSGVVVSNLMGSLVGDTSDLFRAVYKTMNKTFPNLYVFTTKHVIGNSQNLITVAVKPDTKYDDEKLAGLAKEYFLEQYLDDFHDNDHFYIEKIRVDDVPFLTDEYSPVEKLLNPITSQPFVKEGLRYQNTSSVIWYGQSTVIIGLMLTVTIVWVLHFKSLWKKMPS